MRTSFIYSTYCSMSREITAKLICCILPSTISISSRILISLMTPSAIGRRAEPIEYSAYLRRSSKRGYQIRDHIARDGE